MLPTAPKSQVLQRVGECLYRNGNKTYFALIKVRGKQIKRSLKTDDLTIAKRRLSDLRNKSERLHGGDSGNIRFEEFSELWLESIKGTLKPKSFDRRRVAILGLTPFFKSSSIRAIHFGAIDDWRRKRGAVLSARSHNIELETLRLLFQYACDRGMLLENPALKFKQRKEPRTVIEMPTRQEFAQLVTHLRMSRQAVASGAADMVEFLAYSGMRVGEAREVRFSDVNSELRTILITGGEAGTKTHEERIIPLFPSLIPLVERIRNARTNDPSGKIFTIDTPRGALAAACNRAGLKNFSVHSLRHFFASNAIEQGINFKTIAEWLGHSDGGMLVARTYGHLRAEHSASMAERMTFAVAPQAA